MASAADIEVVTALLGRAPRADFRVVVRSIDGDGPVVIENKPLLDDGTPMATTYWLVGSEECLVMGRLESDGGVHRAEADLDEAELQAAHDRYAERRETMIPDGYDGHRPFGGVGGTRRGVKCFHTHLANWMATGDDPVGDWIAAELATAEIRLPAWYRVEDPT